jgi:ABC-2 type transport system permease protein
MSIWLEGPEILNNDNNDLKQLSDQAGIEFAISIVFAFLFVFVVMFSGTLVLQNVIREKQSRVVEVLLSSISARELMAGKILGFGGLGLVQAGIWVLVGLGALFLIGPYFGLPVFTLLTLFLAYLPWEKLLLYLVYFALGYLLVASLSAGMGATMSELMTGQQLQSLIVVLPSVLPFMIFSIILEAPNSSIARLFSFFPLTIPGMMILRTAVASLPWWEISATIGILIISIILGMRVAGKIFEVGILMYGKSLSLREIWRWSWR